MREEDEQETGRAKGRRWGRTTRKGKNWGKVVQIGSGASMYTHTGTYRVILACTHTQAPIESY